MSRPWLCILEIWSASRRIKGILTISLGCRFMGKPGMCSQLRFPYISTPRGVRISRISATPPKNKSFQFFSVNSSKSTKVSTT